MNQLKTEVIIDYQIASYDFMQSAGVITSES